MDAVEYEAESARSSRRSGTVEITRSPQISTERDMSIRSGPDRPPGWSPFAATTRRSRPPDRHDEVIVADHAVVLRSTFHGTDTGGYVDGRPRGRAVRSGSSPSCTSTAARWSENGSGPTSSGCSSSSGSSTTRGPHRGDADTACRYGSRAACAVGSGGRLPAVLRAKGCVPAQSASRTMSASQASAVGVPIPGLISKRSAVRESMCQPESNAARNSPSLTRRGPQSPAGDR